MKKKLLHTPEGVRDLYNKECASKISLQKSIHNVLSLYGYNDIQTPTFEFFDIFNEERGSIDSKDMYKFFDREGNTLVLRPDITPSIARCVAKYYNDTDLPIRLSYIGNTFINNSGLQGKLKEFTQIGAELINDGSVDGDAEVIAMVIDSLLESGLEEFQVELGQVEFFKGLAEEAGMDVETQEYLRELIERKNFFGVEGLLSTLNISEELKAVFLKLPELYGGVEIFEKAKKLTKNDRAIKAIERLETLYTIINEYDLSKYVSFDLGMLSHYKYYTGIILKAYTYGTGDAIVTGGRYDNLLRQFGKTAASVGFAINVDDLMIALNRQNIEIPVKYNNTMILYKASEREMAIKLAGHFRSTGINIEMVGKKENKELEDYVKFAKKNHVGGIFYIEDDQVINVINVKTSESQSVKLSELLGR